MEKYINDLGKECWRGMNEDSPFTEDLFHPVEVGFHENRQWALHSNLGSITVLDRMTGYGDGKRDTETGFSDTDGKFWLASGLCDVRRSGAKTLGEAIAWIKEFSNTCRGE